MSDGPLRVAKLESFYLGGAPLPVDTPMHGGDEMIERRGLHVAREYVTPGRWSAQRSAA